VSHASAGIRVTLMRGGTSKGVFIEGGQLPPCGPDRDAVLLDLMGSPDPMQLDGLGGTHSSTSKVVEMMPSNSGDADVDYRFAQVGIEAATVDHRGNCGNLTAAVGPYAVDAGWVEAAEPVTVVRMRNLNTDTLIVAHVPVLAGRSATSGQQNIAGVPTPGAPIVNEYLEPGGSVLGATLPTGLAAERVRVGDTAIEVSLVDVAHPVAFVAATDLAIEADATPAQLNGQPGMLARIERLRAACAVRLGVVSDPADAATSSPTVPRVVLLRQAPEPGTAQLSVLGISGGRIHHALPITSTLCTAAAVHLHGTLPHRNARPVMEPGDGQSRRVRIAHPKGAVDAIITLRPDAGSPIRSAGVVRTARRLLDGIAYLRDPGLLSCAGNPAATPPSQTRLEVSFG
jgi:hypothetical protein